MGDRESAEYRAGLAHGRGAACRVLAAVPVETLSAGDFQFLGCHQPYAPSPQSWIRDEEQFLLYSEGYKAGLAEAYQQALTELEELALCTR